MARGDVANFVANHTGQISLTFQVNHQAARDVHVAPGQREGIDFRAVECRERPLQIGALGLPGQALANLINVRLHRGVFKRAVFFQYLRVCFFALRDFVGLAHHAAFGFASDRVNNVAAASGE